MPFGLKFSFICIMTFRLPPLQTRKQVISESTGKRCLATRNDWLYTIINNYDFFELRVSLLGSKINGGLQSASGRPFISLSLGKVSLRSLFTTRGCSVWYSGPLEHQQDLSLGDTVHIQNHCAHTIEEAFRSSIVFFMLSAISGVMKCT